MKWSGSRYARNAAPFLLLALGACSNTVSNPPPLLVDSELGRPLADTQRNGDALLDRQRAQVPTPPRPQHKVTSSARRARAEQGSAVASNPLGKQTETLNFVD